MPDLIAANLSRKRRQRGFPEGQFIEALVLLQTAGGDCPEDVKVLAGDPCLERGLGFALPKASALRSFLDRFHDEDLAALRPKREAPKSFLLPSSQPVQGLQQIQAGLVRRIARLYAAQGQGLPIATIDQDATLIESHTQAALAHYEGGRGYPPCAPMAFAALPETVQTRYFRGDSACHENELIGWLTHPERVQEPGGRIGFAISAILGPGLAAEVGKVAQKNWQTHAQEADGTLRQWAQVTFVPGQAGERKDSQPLRYVGLRLLKPQGSLFADGSERHHHAVVTNLDWDGARLLHWHREKAGTMEHVHDEVRNELGGGHMPSQHFAVNAAWFKVALLAYNLASAIKGLCFSPEERTARFKKYRLLLVHLAGRMSRFQCKLRLRFCAREEAIRRIQQVWQTFALPTHATAFRQAALRELCTFQSSESR